MQTHFFYFIIVSLSVRIIILQNSKISYYIMIITLIVYFLTYFFEEKYAFNLRIKITIFLAALSGITYIFHA